MSPSCIVLTATSAATRAYSQQPIATRAPVLPNITHPLQRSSLWGSFQQHEGGLPTNAFWSNLVLEEGVGHVALFPYIVAAEPESGGVRVSYPQLIDGATCVMDAISEDLVVGAGKEATARFVAAF